jgi:hypothetical protein
MKKGTINLTQCGLIKKVIAATGFQNVCLIKKIAVSLKNSRLLKK